MVVPIEFEILHYGKEIVILDDCTLNLITNLLISFMVPVPPYGFQSRKSSCCVDNP